MLRKSVNLSAGLQTGFETIPLFDIGYAAPASLFQKERGSGRNDLPRIQVHWVKRGKLAAAKPPWLCGRALIEGGFLPRITNSR